MNPLISQILAPKTSGADVTTPANFDEMVAHLDIADAYQESCNALDSVFAQMQSLEAAAGTMGNFETALQAMADKEQFLTPETFELMIAGVAGTVGNASVVFEDAGNLSCDTTSGARHATDYALLASGDNFLQKIWAGIKDLAKKAAKFMKNFWDNTFGVVGTLRKRAKAIEEKEGKTKGKLKSGSTVDLTGRNAKALAVGSVVDKATLNAKAMKAQIEADAAIVKDLDKADKDIVASAKDLAKKVSDMAEGKTADTLKAYSEGVVAFGKDVAKAIFKDTGTPVIDNTLSSTVKSNQKVAVTMQLAGGKVVAFIRDDAKAADDAKATLSMPRVVDALVGEHSAVKDIPALDGPGVRDVAGAVTRLAEDIEKFSKDRKEEDKVLEAFDKAYNDMNDAMSKDGDKGMIDRILARRVFSNIREVASNVDKPKMDYIRALISYSHGCLSLASESLGQFEEEDRT